MAPKKRRGQVVHTLRRSRTISGALVWFLGTVGVIFNEALSLVVQASTEFAALAPVAGLAAAMGMETQQTMFGLALAGLALSVYARLNDAHTGANSK